MRLAKVALLAIGLTTLGAPSARAQWDTGAAVDMTGMYIYGMEEAVKQAAGGGSKAKPRPKPKPAPSVSLTYTPSPTRRKAFLKSFFAKLRTSDPETATKMEGLFAQKDMFGEVGKVMRRYGLSANNVADVYAMWWAGSWYASRGRDFEPNRAQLQAVKAQASQALATVMRSKRLDEATKQTLAESCIMHTLLIDGALENSKGNAARRQQIARAVSQGARTAGLNLAAMELTPKGFVFKGS